MGRPALKAVADEVPAAPPVEDWDKVDERMLEIDRLDLELAQLNIELQAAIIEAGKALTPQIKKLLDERESQAKAVLNFAKEHRGDVEGKTWKGAFGKITWPNESSSIDLLLTEEMVIKKLKGAELLHCVRTIESVDKEALRALDVPAAERTKLGFKIVTKNVAGKEEDPPKLSIDQKKIKKHETKADQAPTTGSARKRAR